MTVCTFDVGSSRSNIMDMQADASGCLGNQGCLMEGVIDSIDGVVLHCKQKAGAHLWLWGTGIEESRCSVREPFLTDQIIRVNG